MKKTKICLFSELWESGGVESFLTEMLKCADLEGLEIDVVVPKLGKSIFRAPLEELGVSFIELSGKIRSPKNFALFRDLIKSRGYDAIHFNLFQSFAFYYIHVAKSVGVPIRIAHAHGNGLRKSPTRPLKLLLHKLGRILWKKDITARLACSDEAASFLFGEGCDEIIKNGINSERFTFSEEARARVRSELSVQDEPIIGHVGRMSEEKNQIFLIKMHSHLVKKIPEARLLLVGDGPTEETLRREAKALGIENSVIFYGSSSRVESLMCAMDAFVFPSFSEGLGIVAIEAQCSGLRVLCSDGIPKAAFITDLISSLPLSLGEEAWATELYRKLSDTNERKDRRSDIRDAGFDSTFTARQIIKYYNQDKTREVTYA